MSPQQDPITELDLMAYADGLLDPSRRREVEAHLLLIPDDRALVEEIVAQNVALRAGLEAIADEPVPPRLAAVLRREPRSIVRPMAQVASIAAIAVLSGLGGWWLGALDQSRAHHPFLQGFAANPADSLTELPETLAGEPVALAGEGASAPAAVDSVQSTPPWFADQVVLELRAPDLGAAVAMPHWQRLIEIDGRPTVQLELAGPEGTRLSLYLQTRPSTEAPDVNVVEEAAGSTAYWQDGPLLWALTGETDGGSLEAMARQISGAVQLEPRLEPLEAELTRLGRPTWQAEAVASVPESMPVTEAPQPIALVGG